MLNGSNDATIFVQRHDKIEKQMVIHFELLHREVSSLVSGAEYALDLYSPFVSVKALEEVLASKQARTVVSLVTTWRLEDLVSGISDISLYDFCRDRGIYLFLNQRLHLKSYLADYQRLLTGSANLTGAGLGLHAKSNFETLVDLSEADPTYLVFLAKVKKEAILVNTSIVQMFEEQLSLASSRTTPMINDLAKAQSTLDQTLLMQKHFLISALPMSRSIEQLYDVVSGKKFDDFEIEASAQHDIANYDLGERTYADIADFKDALRGKFFAHPFITALCDFISESRRFGAIKEWVQQNCTDVPVPSRRDLTGNVQVLYNWLVDLGTDRYEVTRPNYSEIISPRKKN